MEVEGTTATFTGEPPRGDAKGFIKYLRYDILSGLLVFLIAMPLCLAISKASGEVLQGTGEAAKTIELCPPIAGILTAIVGAVVVSLISNSELTIKGPAAGMIVIVAGAFQSMATEFGPENAYRAVLAIGVAAAVVQIIFAWARTGVLGEFFPAAAVHGMLAAIGIIILSKQIHVLFGVTGLKVKEPLEIIAEIPHSAAHMNPEIFCIGLVSLVILFGLAFTKVKWMKKIPAPMIVVMAAVILGSPWVFDLDRAHTYSMFGNDYEITPKYLVNVPSNILQAITTPSFVALRSPIAWYWVLMFALVGSLESLLSAKAIDMIDPYNRKTNLNRDLFGIGVANMISSAIGGLPMISEIVRSKANIDNGAKTRFSNFWHGIFLLVFVSFFPWLIHRIPTAALAAMLILTGFRLASPAEFLKVYKTGKAQLAIFVATIVGVLATDLLLGVLIGITLKVIILVINGVPARSFLKPYLDVEHRPDGTAVIHASQSAIFSNWIPFKRQIEQIGLVQHANLIVDLSGCKVVDHNTMTKLKEMERDFVREGLTLTVVGLDHLTPVSAHALATHKQPKSL